MTRCRKLTDAAQLWVGNPQTIAASSAGGHDYLDWCQDCTRKALRKALEEPAK